ncbi:NAD(P)/FAD-dependent oxidoreductase [Zafaria sp. J156]|nr:FAD-dependent oxidoreductase [Zafaria sp. J156]
MPTAFDRAEARIPAAAVDAALAGAATRPYWLDSPARPAASAPLSGRHTADLAVLGAGYTGLWTALLAKRADPARRVVVLEGGRIGWAASGRNGGFCEDSLTHGDANGQRHLPRENGRLIELGRENLAALLADLDRHGIDADVARSGSITAATEEHQVAWLREEADGGAGSGPLFLDRAAMLERIGSPLLLAGLREEGRTVLVHPAKLAWGLARSCAEAGVEIIEQSPVRSLERGGRGPGVVLRTDAGRVAADQVALAGNAFPPLLRRLRLHTVPVYDYVLMTEPLDAAQWSSIGWDGGEGLADAGNRFHYLRPVRDADGGRRILIGGYDAIYRYGRSLDPAHLQHPASFRRLAAHFLAFFPQLEGVRFSHQWGGAIDTCSRFFPFFETAHGGRTAYAAGFTGLGVGASRFAARVMLDLLGGAPTELTGLELVRRKPLPFPPEPGAWLGVQAMTAALVASDRNGGRRGPFLQAMDAIGMGFDS